MSGTTKHKLIWALVLGVGVTVAGLARADEKVEINQVPNIIRHEIEKTTKGGSKVSITAIANGEHDERDYMVHYLDPGGKEQKLRLGPTGQVLDKGETHEQRRRDEEAHRAQLKSDAERAKYDAELAAQRDKEDRERYDAYQASANKQVAEGKQEFVDRTYLGLRKMSEEYNSTDRHRVPYSELPPGVRKTFDMETNQLKDIDYYKYTVEGKLFYSVHYNVGDRRMVARVDQNGILLGKNELNPVPPVVVEEHVVSLPANQVPPNIMAVIQRETQGMRNFSYFRITRGDNVFFTVHYTDVNRVRHDLWMDPDGGVVTRRLTALQIGDHNFKLEWGGPN